MKTTKKKKTQLNKGALVKRVTRVRTKRAIPAGTAYFNKKRAKATPQQFMERIIELGVKKRIKRFEFMLAGGKRKGGYSLLFAYPDVWLDFPVTLAKREVRTVIRAYAKTLKKRFPEIEISIRG